MTSPNLRSREYFPSAGPTAARSYCLRCQICNARFPDDGFLLKCPQGHDGLLITEYSSKEFFRDLGSEGIYRYQHWLPIERELAGSGRTVTFRSRKLEEKVGVKNLWIAFNGYWPEKGACLRTATFKELEAYSVLARVPVSDRRVLVLASAGNTAAAFAWACSRNRIPCLIVIPASALKRMQFEEELDECVRIVCLEEPADYCDAIELADRVARLEGFYSEGGVKNVGRRDGIGTTLLNATETIGEMPAFYFQAVGSGTGGIAVYEASQRLSGDGQFGKKSPRLMLSQNSPFAPMYTTWKSGTREFREMSVATAKEQLGKIAASVLSNRKPCFSVAGGVYDVLCKSQGDMLIAENDEARAAAELFANCEGIDIDPAAGVALASLIQMARAGKISEEGAVLLHVTSGGWLRHNADYKLVPIRPSLRLGAEEALSEQVISKVYELFV